MNLFGQHNKTQPTSDSELTERIKRGDQRAMQQVYTLYAGYLMAVCSRYVTENEDRRDILQESFIKAFTHADTFQLRQGATLKAWLARIVVNESINFLKHRQRLGFIDNDKAIADVPDNTEPDTSDIAFQTIVDMIQQLPAGYRTVFNLYVFEKKSHREIAQLLNISEGTSASQYLRAKRILARQIKEYKNTL